MFPRHIIINPIACLSSWWRAQGARGTWDELGRVHERGLPRASPSSSTNLTIHHVLLWDTAHVSVLGSRFYLIVWINCSCLVSPPWWGCQHPKTWAIVFGIQVQCFLHLNKLCLRPRSDWIPKKYPAVRYWYNSTWHLYWNSLLYQEDWL